MSSTPPAATYRVCLAGFSEFERSTLASYFRLATQRQPVYVQVALPEQSDFLIADADQRDAVDAVLAVGRAADAVFVGASAPVDAMAWLTRPIDPNQILRELDMLVALRVGAGALGAAPRRPEVDRLLRALPAQQRALAEAMLPGPPYVAPGRDVLVVEDSAIARKFLTLRLQRFGYQVQVATNGEQAIELVNRQAFALVFADVVLGPPGSVDGLRVCQYIKQRAAQGEGPPTAVILVTGLGGPSDRVRGSLAGCDAYLVKPLHEESFVAVLQAIDPAFRTPLVPR
jgi:CheY-like chemotaxis protein